MGFGFLRGGVNFSWGGGFCVSRGCCSGARGGRVSLLFFEVCVGGAVGVLSSVSGVTSCISTFG